MVVMVVLEFLTCVFSYKNAHKSIKIFPLKNMRDS